jgi:hypothetical protein
MGGKGKDNTTETQSAFATVKQMNELEVKLTAKIDANHAECISKIDANKADTDAKIDANQAETNKRSDKLTEIVLKLVETINSGSDKNS